MPAVFESSVLLSEEQRNAVEAAIDASIAVIGGPASGKTVALIERTARIAQARGRGATALVVTPTRGSASRLRDRLAFRIGGATPGSLARSLASVAFGIIQQHARRAGRADPVLLTGAEQDTVIAHLLDADDSSWPPHLGGELRASAAFRSEVREFIGAVARLGITTEELADARGPYADVWLWMAGFVTDYRRAVAMAHPDALETSELLRAAASVADKSDVAARYGAVLVDDAQELTHAGNDLVLALRDAGAAVSVFGDPDISGGAFRGASVTDFARLTHASDHTLSLTDTFQRAPDIAWAVRSLTQRIGAGGAVSHRHAPGDRPEERAVLTSITADEHAEADDIANRMHAARLDRGTAWDDMAVIVREGSHVEVMAARLAERDVPTHTVGIQRPLREFPIVADLLQMLAAADDGAALSSDGDAGERAERMLTSAFGGMTAVQVRRLRSLIRQRASVASGTPSEVPDAQDALAEVFTRPASLALIDGPETRMAQRVAETLSAVRAALAEGASVHEALWLLWSRARTSSGARLADDLARRAEARGVIGRAAARDLDALVAVFDRAKRYVERFPEHPAYAFVHDVLSGAVPQDSLATHHTRGAVSVLTPQAALGREFDTVFVAGVQERRWPNLTVRGTVLGAARLEHLRTAEPSPEPDQREERREVLSDEIRLFVRAVSRARTQVVVTASSNDESTPSVLVRALDPMPGHGRAGVVPSATRPGEAFTLRGEVARLRRVLTTSRDPRERNDAAGQLAVLARAGVAGADPDTWYGMRSTTTTAPLSPAAIAVSPSRIEAIEECPLQWAIDALGGAATRDAASIGTVLHAALEAGAVGGAERMREVLDEQWQAVRFDAPWLGQRARMQAEEHLGRMVAYLDSVDAQRGALIGAEVGFEFAVTLDDVPTLILDASGERSETCAVVRGRIDRIERYPAGLGDHHAARGRGSTPIEAAGPGADHQVVVADVKTGLTADRLTDGSVRADAQLAAYQIAVASGAVQGEPIDAREVAGARLVTISKGTASSPYRVAHQQVLTDDDRSRFLARVASAARDIQGPQFHAAVSTHCDHSHAATLCRVHTIAPVSAGSPSSA